MKLKNSSFVTLLAALFISTVGCSAVTPKILKPGESIPPRKLAIFFDGTANAESSDTNIKKLHSLISLQNKKNISTFYVEGVGANGKVIGMVTGWGIGLRVRLAYSYLLDNYQKGDRIYIFGFSRGAYSARMLASLLYHAGLPEKGLHNNTSSQRIAENIYEAFKGEMSIEERKTSIKAAIKEYSLPELKAVNIDFIGLWDTVEALGVPDYEENFKLTNGRYGDQLCNVKKAAHALALDDNRSRIFTPILLTRNYLLKKCEKELDGRVWSPTLKNISDRLDSVVEEVWFTGAHADVGGGYQDALLSGVSLNWMIGQLKMVDKGLLPAEAKVRFEASEAVHDPEKGLLWGTLYKEKWRDFISYAGNSRYNNGKLKVHSSVLTRLQKPERLAPKETEHRESQWRLVESFPSCFGEERNEEGGYYYKENNIECRLERIIELEQRALTKP